MNINKIFQRNIITFIICICAVTNTLMPVKAAAADSLPQLEAGYSWYNGVLNTAPAYSNVSDNKWKSGYEKHKMTDGTATESYAGVAVVDSTTEPLYITYDLGEVKRIGGATLSYDYRTSAGYYHMYGSLDNVSWDEINVFDTNDGTDFTNASQHYDKIYFEEPKNYRYIKLATVNNSYNILKIYEFELFVTDNELILPDAAEGFIWKNVLSGKIGDAYNTVEGNGDIKNVTDGIFATEANYALFRNESEPANVVFDLGQNFSIGAAKLNYNYRQGVGKISLWTSLDNVNYNKLCTFNEVGGLVNASNYTTSELFDNVPARYIKLSVMNKSWPGAPADIMKLYEFELYAVVRDKVKIYVSPDGSSDGDGSQELPLDIYSAVNAYKNYKDIGVDVDGIYFFDGDYYLNKTLELNSSHSGIKFYGVGNNVNLYGAYEITQDKISIADNSDCDGRLPADLIGKIVKIDLSDYPQSEFEKISNQKNDMEYNLSDNEVPKDIVSDIELVDNGIIKTSARWPDEGWARMGEVDTIDSQNAQFVTTNDLDWSTTASDMKIFNYRFYDYHAQPGDITEIHPENRKVSINQKLFTSIFNENSRYYFYNIPEEISKKGEYYINIAEKTAYYYPEDINNMKLSVTSMSNGLIKITEGTKDILFDNINFSQTRGALITAEGCENIDITNSEFTYTGGSGVFLNNSTKCDLTKNKFDNIGFISVYISGGDRPSLTSGENTIYDSRFTNGARTVRTYSPFVRLGGVGAKVENNYFYNHTSHAIIFHGNDHIIENNIFDSCVTETDDAGCIYAGRNATYWGTVIKNNIFKNLTLFLDNESLGSGVYGVYMDDLLPGTTVEDNVFFNCNQAINIGGGRGSKVTGNLIYDCFKAGTFGYREPTVKDWLTIPNSNIGLKTSGFYWTVINQMQQSEGYDEEKWFSQYPAYKQLVSDLKLQLNADGTGNGNTAEAHKLKDTEFSNNLIMGERAQIPSGNDYPFSMFIYSYYARKINPTTNEEQANGIYTNNYTTDILDGVKITGNNIEGIENVFDSYILTNNDTNHFLTKDSALSTKKADISGFEIPDVSKAGTVTMDVSDIYDANEVYICQKDRMDYSNSLRYRIEDFKNTTSSDITKLNGFDFSTTASYSKPSVSNNQLKIPGGQSVSIKPDKVFDGEATLCIRLNGSAEIKLVANTTEIKEVSNSEFTIYEYPVTNLSEIIVTAKGNFLSNSSYINYVALNKKGNTNTDIAYFESDFEEYQPGASVQDSFDEAFTFFVKGCAGATIFEESDGNKAVKLSQLPEETRNDYFEIHFDPVNLSDKVLCIEYAIKKQTQGGVLSAACALDGFNMDKPTNIIQSVNIKQYEDGGDLKIGDKIIADNQEMFDDYVRLRWLIDKKNKSLKVYKLTSSNYELISEWSNYIFSEFASNIRFMITGTEETESSYLIDNIAIYDYNNVFTLRRTQDDSVAGNLGENKGQEVYLTPKYLPSTGIGTIIAAIYNQDGKLVNSQIGEYKPDEKLKLLVPSDDKKYNIKYFTWKDISEQAPVNDSIEFK